MCCCVLLLFIHYLKKNLHRRIVYQQLHSAIWWINVIESDVLKYSKRIFFR